MGIRFNFIVKKDTGIYYCMICDCNMHHYKCYKEHRNGRRHNISLQQHGCYIILQQENHQYFCKCCGCKVCGWINVYPHLIGKNHTVLLNKSDESLQNFKGLSRNFIVRKSDNSYSCSICNCNMSGPLSAKEHLAGYRHAISMRDYGCDIVLIRNNHHYYCKLCKCQMLGYYHIWLHINGKRHRSLRNEE